MARVDLFHPFLAGVVEPFVVVERVSHAAATVGAGGSLVSRPGKVP